MSNSNITTRVLLRSSWINLKRELTCQVQQFLSIAVDLKLNCLSKPIRKCLNLPDEIVWSGLHWKLMKKYSRDTFSPLLNDSCIVLASSCMYSMNCFPSGTQTLVLDPSCRRIDK